MKRTGFELMGIDPSTRTSHRKPSGTAAIQSLKTIAEKLLEAAHQEAYNRGRSDYNLGKPNHAPYGFSDLVRAYKKGFLAASAQQRGII